MTSPESLEYWVSKIIDAYFRLYKNNLFTESKIVNDYNEEYHKENNNTMTYLDDYIVDDILNLRPPELYSDYELWSEENGYNTASPKMMNEAVLQIFGLMPVPRKVNGKSQRVYGFKKEKDENGIVKIG